jgi:hypothetical protein
VGALALCPFAAAQIAVTELDYGPMVDAPNRTAGNVTYLNQYTPLDYVSSSLGTYTVNGASATSVSFRRNTGAGNANNSSVYYAYSSLGSSTVTAVGKGDTSPTLPEVMLSGDMNQGVRNVFANGTGADAGNIERIDFYFSGGYTVKAGDAILVVDLENPGDHGDGFRLAAFTSVGTVNGFANAPTTYANSGLLIAPGALGDPLATPDGTNARYAVSSTTAGDSLASSQSITALDTNSGTANSTDLYLVGILIRFTDLGLSVGQTIYGYSFMAGDVTASSGADLVNWNNAAVYATNTDANTWGNADFAGVSGRIAQPLPEPAAFGAALLGSALAFAMIRHRRTAR